ncbi:hypothetical protein JYT72_00725, partial [Crocinitomix catalasitica]|nr:hypothetical protein [Crocinitomix catalasitica]
KILMMTDGWNWGATGLLCAHLRQRANCSFYGDSCGAPKWGMNGYPVVLRLPNSAINIYIPRLQLRIDHDLYHSPDGIEMNSLSTE